MTKLQLILLNLMAVFDHKQAYKRKFDDASLEREPIEFWHGVDARLDGLARDTCPYRFEKADNWRRGYDGRRD